MSQQPASATPSNHDLNQWIELLKKCEYIKEADVKALCNRAKEILQEESNVQHVQSPVTVSVFSILHLISHNLDLW
jgi:serine/threonine-protein phosphatase 4 catalytic subunit